MTSMDSYPNFRHVEILGKFCASFSFSNLFNISQKILKTFANPEPNFVKMMIIFSWSKNWFSQLRPFPRNPKLTQQMSRFAKGVKIILEVLWQFRLVSKLFRSFDVHNMYSTVKCSVASRLGGPFAQLKYLLFMKPPKQMFGKLLSTLVPAGADHASSNWNCWAKVESRRWARKLTNSWFDDNKHQHKQKKV